MGGARQVASRQRRRARFELRERTLFFPWSLTPFGSVFFLCVLCVQTDMDQLSEVMELEFPDGDYETAGGYTSSVFGTASSPQPPSPSPTTWHGPCFAFARLVCSNTPEVTATGGPGRCSGV